MMGTQRVIRSNFSRGEVFFGLMWLSLAAALSVFLEVIYLGSRLAIPGLGSLPFPYTILFAFGFTMVLSRTAMLWTSRISIALIPAAVWLMGFLTLTFWARVTGDQLVGTNLWSMLLLIAGMCGGGWPLIREK